MARARKVELDCEASFATAAVRVIEVRTEEVFEQAEGILNVSDVERVHDMRVATRRLRAALEVFGPCFPHKRHRKALKKVKALADALGGRRDVDVEISLLEELDEGVTEADRDALRDLIAAQRDRQREANEELAPYVASKRLKKLRRQLRKLVEVVEA